MDFEEIRNLSSERTNKIRAEQEKVEDFPFQVAHINLDNEKDPSAILKKDSCSITVISDQHSYSKKDRIFPVNQDENTVFAQYVYQDSLKNKYNSVLDLCTGSGVISMALAKAGSKDVLASDINKRAEDFIRMNNKVNLLNVKFIEGNLFKKISGKFDKITINPPFMPSPENTFPLHAQGGAFGTENVVKIFFEECWSHLNKGGCIQGIFHSFANDSFDTILSIINDSIPSGWSYEITHVFPIKNIPIELYTTSFAEQEDYAEWKSKIDDKNLKYVRFFMLTIRNDGYSGLKKEMVSKPRIYNLLYPPTTLSYLSKHNLKIKILMNPISEEEYPLIGHLLRLSRYNYFIYLTLNSLLT